MWARPRQQCKHTPRRFLYSLTRIVVFVVCVEFCGGGGGGLIKWRWRVGDVLPTHINFNLSAQQCINHETFHNEVGVNKALARTNKRARTGLWKFYSITYIM